MADTTGVNVGAHLRHQQNAVRASPRTIRWRQRDRGEQIHRRYVRPNSRGNLDDEVGAKQTSDDLLLDRNLCPQCWAEYNLDSTVYELMQAILAVDDGRVRKL